LNGDPDAALPHLARFVNLERGVDTVEIYASKFHNRPVHRATLADLARRLKTIAPNAPEVAALERRLLAHAAAV